MFETERDAHLSTIKDNVDSLSQAKGVMYKNYNDMGPGDSTVLSYPKTKRDEIKDIRRRLDDYQKFK